MYCQPGYGAADDGTAVKEVAATAMTSLVADPQCEGVAAGQNCTHATAPTIL